MIYEKVSYSYYESKCLAIFRKIHYIEGDTNLKWKDRENDKLEWGCECERILRDKSGIMENDARKCEKRKWTNKAKCMSWEYK